MQDLQMLKKLIMVVMFHYMTIKRKLKIICAKLVVASCKVRQEVEKRR